MRNIMGHWNVAAQRVALGLVAGLTFSLPSKAQWLYNRGAIICTSEQANETAAQTAAGAAILPRNYPEPPVPTLFVHSPCIAIDALDRPGFTSNQLATALTIARAVMASGTAASAAAAHGTTLTGIANSLVQTQQSLSTMQTSLLQGLRSELTLRINGLPAELAKDGAAYETLKARLVRDLTEVFQIRGVPP
jgi:hypothetical protein